MPPSLQQRDTAQKETRHKQHESGLQINKLAKCHFSSEAAFDQRVATQDDTAYNWSRRWSYPPMNPVLDSGAFVHPFIRFPGPFKSVSAGVKVQSLSGGGPGIVGSTMRWKQDVASRSGESNEPTLRRVKRGAGLRIKFAEPIVTSEHPAQNGSATEAELYRSARRARFPEPLIIVDGPTQNGGVTENDAASGKKPRPFRLAKTAIGWGDTEQDGGIKDGDAGTDGNPHNIKPTEPAVVSDDIAQNSANTNRDSRGAEQNDFQRLADVSKRGLRAAWNRSIGRTKRWILDPRLRGGGTGASKMNTPDYTTTRGHSTSAMQSQHQASPATTSPSSAATSSPATITTASSRLPADVDSSSEHRPVSTKTTKTSARTSPIPIPDPTKQSQQISAGSRTPEAGTGAPSPSTPKGNRATQSPPHNPRAEPNLFTDDPRGTIQLNVDTIRAARTLAPNTPATARLTEVLEAENERLMKEYLDHVEQFTRTAARRQHSASNITSPIDQRYQCHQCGKSMTSSDAVCECYGQEDLHDHADEAEKKKKQQQRANEKRKRALIKLLKMTQIQE
ncbi:hypothetical protein FB567DRAFT_588391 [Paraphoma chrysanthemicola]|uniref:Uncharacterized protein n=1 Tax=Paraphoma chrysanthemicola TaxID=798071 RepID=A0A8K0RCY6_9PLEO|nr:hypothetical protein FB567DRAFT_588391 [Paraphoma chrysanthemicola]